MLPLCAPVIDAPPSAWHTYHCGLAGLIEAGQRYGRLDPRDHLTVDLGTVRTIPIQYHGFAWRSYDFCQLAAAEMFHSKDLAHRYTDCGLGVRLVGVRKAACDELFYRPQMPFAVTAVLRPQGGPDDGAVLEFYNPNVFAVTPWNGASAKLSRDLTAPWAAAVSEAPRQYFRGFTAPTDTRVKPQLVMIEPYQRGKIPVVFIHGLYSDPVTWADTINELSCQADLYRTYQFWLFRYPTGGALMESAAVLRERLQLARQLVDPAHNDPALDSMVLIGHSLGGLVSQTQIVDSSDVLWNKIAYQPLEAVRADPKTRAQLSRDFFFEPLPFVTRVVFVGTPHQGSTMARRLLGRASSMLVRFGSEAEEQYRELMEANRDIFNPAIARSRPTSVDILEPSSPLLAALAQMCVNPAVRTHSIIGTGGVELLGEPGDGVVSVSSARFAGAVSEVYVAAKHEKLHRDPASIAEMARILRQHASEQGPIVVVGSRR